MNEEKTTWQWRQGYDYATAKHKAEIDRLRAENAELREALHRLLTVAGEGCSKGRAIDLLPMGTVKKAFAILAKTAKEGE